LLTTDTRISIANYFDVGFIDPCRYYVRSCITSQYKITSSAISYWSLNYELTYINCYTSLTVRSALIILIYTTPWRRRAKI